MVCTPQNGISHCAVQIPLSQASHSKVAVFCWQALSWWDAWVRNRPKSEDTSQSKKAREMVEASGIHWCYLTVCWAFLLFFLFFLSLFVVVCLKLVGSQLIPLTASIDCHFRKSQLWPSRIMILFPLKLTLLHCQFVSTVANEKAWKIKFLLMFGI